MQRIVEIPLPKFIEDGAKRLLRSRLLEALGCNVPILLAVLGFLAGFQALHDRQVMQGMGFDWAVINEKTERAQSIILWTAAHLIVPLVFVVLYNAVYLWRPQLPLRRHLRLAVLLVLAAFCLWYFEQGFYLSRKLVTME
jgi:hypothetical protein